jgi:16S rRNA (guanine527-N7)-methyltransferase
LVAGGQQLGLALTDTQIDALMGYLGLLHKWSKVYNLTAVRDPLEMVTLHLLDSLAVVPALLRHLGTSHNPIVERAALAGGSTSTSTSTSPSPSPAPAPPPSPGPGPGEPTSASPAATSATTPARAFRLLDVGSGAGLPGVVIAIACPHIQVTCIDAVSKKAAFVQQVAASLGLPHLRGLHQRIEQLDTPHDLVCSRAFASLADFVHGSAKALAPGGVWLALKGKAPTEEMSALGTEVAVFHVEQLQVPGLDAQRCLIWMHPALSR